MSTSPHRGHSGNHLASRPHPTRLPLPLSLIALAQASVPPSVPQVLNRAIGIPFDRADCGTSPVRVELPTTSPPFLMCVKTRKTTESETRYVADKRARVSNVSWINRRPDRRWLREVFCGVAWCG